jgi:hypothetical protein
MLFQEFEHRSEPALVGPIPPQAGIAEIRLLDVLLGVRQDEYGRELMCVRLA